MTVSLLLKNLLITLVVPTSLGVYVPLLLARGSPPKSGVALAMALVLLAIGAGIYLWSVWNFATRGRGTPLPLDAPKKLVIQGPYQYTRNAMYVALLSALLGWLLLFQTGALAIYLLIAYVAVSLFVYGFEEPHLRQVFGAEYEAYVARVPRWLPRFPRRPDA
jgi:protein-S-isoprenylcysteine O-methyltransferase Ste14